MQQALSQDVLLLKISYADYDYNFLTYAGMLGKQYFKTLVALATHEGIDAALADPPLNEENETPLHAILFAQAKYKTNGVHTLIEKASKAEQGQKSTPNSASISKYYNVINRFNVLHAVKFTGNITA